MALSMPHLLDELQIKTARLRNRIAVSPMCQYTAKDGVPHDWHLVHLGARAIGGAGLVVAEATAVSPEGRITPGCTGLWNDSQADAWRPIARFISSQGALPGIQIGHAGRKASASRPWEGDAHLPADHPDAWQPIGPSSNALGGKLPRAPLAMSLADIRRVREDFVAATRRAVESGFQWLMLHFAHGYLAQSFFSPLANRRQDEYGGSFENRARFLLETFEAVRAVWPERYPLSVRLGVLDYVDGEQPLEESIELLRRMKAGGLDVVDVSMGFNTPDVSRVPWGEEAFLAPVAARIKREVGLVTATSWNVRDPKHTANLIASEQLDLVMLAKSFLSDANWPYHAAQALGVAEPHSLLPDPYAFWLKGQ
jgi:2,4-dienoyl-CoA reductase-like NADH-dependent reductase (Old Yellow Enzyme family)